ncbi:hypothetical protein M595_2752 [Lyngbya aestuarii BL J]|uniref:Uncharacterized protein n=1 Tax=Lyngbya aestuarii BL J TaxID=1348334 RepID=U7QHA8_9CYAN|nr:hypothetical protein M595_2752 [Lyngbya aestuarii BL J]
MGKGVRRLGVNLGVNFAIALGSLNTKVFDNLEPTWLVLPQEKMSTD